MQRFGRGIEFCEPFSSYRICDEKKELLGGPNIRNGLQRRMASSLDAGSDNCQGARSRCWFHGALGRESGRTRRALAIAAKSVEQAMGRTHIRLVGSARDRRSGRPFFRNPIALKHEVRIPDPLPKLPVSPRQYLG